MTAAMTIHFRGKPAERRTVPGTPRVGEVIDADGHLWRVAAVVYGEGIDLYAVQVSDALAADLRAEWEAWGDTPTLPEPAETEKSI